MAFYIERHLKHDSRTISQSEFCAELNIAIILAEPGGGKSEFLNSVATSFGSECDRAAIFLHKTQLPKTDTLVIDALDEVSRVDSTTLHSVIVKAHEIGAKRVIFSSRSGEWEEAETRYIRDTFSVEPKIYRLFGLDPEQQQKLFEHHFATYDFSDFELAVSKFNLRSLLENPQLLQIFGSAFAKGGGQFKSKESIFSDAVEQMATEKNPAVSQKLIHPPKKIVACAEPIFAKLLLSGSVGVARTTHVQTSQFPLLIKIGTLLPELLPEMLNSQLFRPASGPDLHEPIHRIIQEFCAARYLVSKIEDEGDLLTSKRCLSLVAPNGAVREELRGLLAWMAALGHLEIQSSCISLDPYAVLSNGDPSKLAEKSKLLLLEKIGQLGETDPYFRRSDSWRSFSVAGFFTSNLIGAVRPMLCSKPDGSHTLSLLLELLKGAEIAPELEAELAAIVLNEEASKNERYLALEVLLEATSIDLSAVQNMLKTLGSHESLSLVCEIVVKNGITKTGKTETLTLLAKLAELYPTQQNNHERTIGRRYFVKQLVETFNKSECEYFLNALTPDLVCTCSAQRPSRCRCRVGKSKIMGLLLDRYCELHRGSYSPTKIWKWCQNLVFLGTPPIQSSKSVTTFAELPHLRQSVQKLALNDITDPIQLRKAQIKYFSHNSFHAGLQFQPEDYINIIEHAFENKNLVLWTSFFAPHSAFREEHTSHPIRSLMRGHSRIDPLFLPAWYRSEQSWRNQDHHEESNHRRTLRRHERRQNRNRRTNTQHFNRHKPQIESGQHWWWLRKFSDSILLGAEMPQEVAKEPSIACKALQNCLPFLKKNTPSLRTLAAGDETKVARVLSAACLVIFRATGNLSSIDRDVLWAVKVDFSSYSNVEQHEAELMRSEIDRLLFTDDEDREHYLQEYVEASIRDRTVNAANAGWILKQSQFEFFRQSKAIEWLEQYPHMSISTAHELFEVAAQSSNRPRLAELVKSRVADFFGNWPIGLETHELEQYREFWTIRLGYFTDNTDNIAWQFLLSDRQHIFMFNRVESFGRGDFPHWPTLSPDKILRILKYFSPLWPEVHLPSSYGSSSPAAEQAHRFLIDLVWHLERQRAEESLKTLEEILSNPMLSSFHKTALHLKKSVVRQSEAKGYTPPHIDDVVKFLDHHQLASVGDLRAHLTDELEVYQAILKGGDTDPVAVFYTSKKHVDENTASKRVVDWLRPRFASLQLSVSIESHMHCGKRCDITLSHRDGLREKMLVVEVKGQWNRELYSAAQEQLYERYAIHPNADNQGAFLVLWYGAHVPVNGKKGHDITNPTQLKRAIVERMPEELLKRIDIIVLDLEHSTK